MCGRYAAVVTGEDVIAEFEVDLDATDRNSRSLLSSPQHPAPGSPDYNMAPSKQAPVVLSREPGERQLRLLTWGLVPPWAKETSVGMRMINARAESLLDKRTFAAPARRRRALIPAAGWYEWQASPVATDAKGKPRKQPFFVSRGDDRSLAFGAIYEFWKDRTATDQETDDAWVVSFSIITTAAEPGMDRIHDRQPLVIDPQVWSSWLDPTLDDDSAVHDLLTTTTSAPAGRFQAWAVSAAVNRVGHGGSELTDPAPSSSLVGVIDPATGEIIGG